LKCLDEPIGHGRRPDLTARPRFSGTRRADDSCQSCRDIQHTASRRERLGEALNIRIYSETDTFRLIAWDKPLLERSNFRWPTFCYVGRP
jgi:hypothetical protein